MQSQKDFFYAVMPQGGLPCLAWLVAGQDGFRHKVFKNLDEFCTELDTLDYTKHDYYFAISTLREPSITVGGKKRVRVQANALLTRALILDIDFKDGLFKTHEDAIVEVDNLAESLGIAKPIIVNSGYGLHVYWPFAEGIDSKDWTVIAKQFKKHCTLFAPALVADGSRVADSAGVLRIPESFNLKYNTQVPVDIVRPFSDFTDVGQLKAALGIGAQVRVAKPVNLAVQYDSPPVPLISVAKNCNWVRTYLANRATASEPEWYAMLGLAPYMEHTSDKGVVTGEAIAQAISQGHDSYDPDAVATKYEQSRAAQTGPSTCERFRGIDAKRCEGCPFAATVKTPIQAANYARPATSTKQVETQIIDDDGNVDVAVVTIPLYPKPYFRGEDGGVFVRARVKNEDDGTWDEIIEKVYDYDLYPVKRYRGETTENEIMEIHAWLPKDGLRIFKLPTGLLAEQKKLAIFLAEKGVISEHGKSLRLAKYLVDFIRYMQTVGAAEVEFSRFGWRDVKSANPKFVVGNGFIDREGQLVPASYAHFLKDPAKAVATSGSLEAWKRGFALYESIPHSQPYILACMLGFAAPLMAFTEYAGVLYNMVGNTSAGKSTALRLMTSVWGQPKENHVLINDNVIPVYNFIGYLNAIPVAMDELTNMPPDKLSDFALAFTGGRGKMRANRDGTNQVNTIEWDTIVAGTSNTSLYDKIAINRKSYSAEAMRIYEVAVTTSDEERRKYKPLVDDSIEILKANYGHAGRDFISYIIKNIPEVQKLITDTIKKIDASGQLRTEERFWAAMFACVYVGGTISGQVLKLHNYNMRDLLAWSLGISSEVREAVRTSVSDPVSILSNFFNSNLDSIIRFKDNKPYMGTDGRALSNLRTIKVRMELSEDNTPETAWVSTPAFKEYCIQNKVDAAWIRKELKSLGILTEENASKRLASGSGLASNSSIKCWSIDLTHPKMVEVAVETIANTETLETGEE